MTAMSIGPSHARSIPLPGKEPAETEAVISTATMVMGP
jgi:hypothetical protein